MKPLIAILLGAGMLAFTGPAVGRDDPLVNPSGIPIAWGKSREPTIEEIGRGIVAGCARQARREPCARRPRHHRRRTTLNSTGTNGFEAIAAGSGLPRSGNAHRLDARGAAAG